MASWSRGPRRSDRGSSRFALDDKASLVSTLQAVEILLGEGFRPKPTVYLAYGHDEEVGGRRGAAKIAALLDSRGVRPSFVLDEGQAITEGVIQACRSPWP